MFLVFCAAVFLVVREVVFPIVLAALFLALLVMEVRVLSVPAARFPVLLVSPVLVKSAFERTLF